MRDSPIDRQQPALVLASASPRRRELLAALGVPFTVAAADVDEGILPGEKPAVAAVRLATSKASTIAAAAPEAIVIGADTIVVLNGRLLGKPMDAEEAVAMLRALRGREHAVITGVAVCDASTGDLVTAAPITAVWMRTYTDDEIAASITSGTPFDKAGAYAVQDGQLAPVARIEGCYCNVVGLPLWTVYGMLAAGERGFPLERPSATRAVCAGCPLAAPSPNPSPAARGRGA